MMSEMKPTNSNTSVSSLEESDTDNVNHKSAEGASKNVDPPAGKKAKSDSTDNHQEDKEVKEVHMTLTEIRELRKDHAVQSDCVKSITALTSKQEE
jgi:hypothetical protein